MKTSLRKLKGFAVHRHGEHKDRRDLPSSAQLDELALASQDMLDMRDCYDSLLSAAAATANSAYEFSESLREMGACLLAKTALNDDEESGRVLLMLGKVQFELQKLVDSYRSHIFKTITSPSESLLNELQIVEEMKQQCEEKRVVYEHMLMKQREKGRGRNRKGDSFSVQQLQAAYEEYDEEATLFVFRLKSLKQGQSRSLLTQASRHHAAQLHFFKRALQSLEALEPHVKLVTEQQHIDYHFSGLEDDDRDYSDDDDDDDSDDMHDDGELSFDYGQNGEEEDVFTSRNLMELDMVDLTFPQVATLDVAKENLDGRHRKSSSFRGEIRAGSQSAPLFAANKSDPADKIKQMRPLSTRKFNTYVLPTPVDSKGSNFTAFGSPVPHTLKTSLNGNNLWHSSPIEPKQYEKLIGKKITGSTGITAHSVLRENNNAAATRLRPPLADGLLVSRPEPLASSYSKKIKRQAFSGPITSKASTKPFSVEHPKLFSGPLWQNPMAPLLSSPKISPKVSPSASPTFVSSPKISELHELPRPPVSSTSKSSRPSSLVGHSAPLFPKGHMHPATSKSLVSSQASPLPTPAQMIARSISIPSNGLRATALNVCKPLDATLNSEMAENVASPPLTPISLPKIQPSAAGSETLD